MLAFAFAVLSFAVATTCTPGPNNVTLTALGSQFGFRRSIPALLGVALGFPFMLTLVGIGLGIASTKVALIVQIVTPLGIIFLIYFAYRTATARVPTPGDQQRPLSFWALSLFQWVNPKAWAMAVVAHAAYQPLGVAAGLSGLGATLATGLLFLPVTCVSSSLWVGLGSVIARVFYSRPRVFRIFRLCLAALLLASLLPMLKLVAGR